MKKKKTYTKEERIKLLEESIALASSGYGGINRQGDAVDRRIFPDAIPFAYNPSMNIPHPKKV